MTQTPLIRSTRQHPQRGFSATLESTLSLDRLRWCAFVKNLNRHNVVTGALPEGECGAAFDDVPKPDE